MAEQIQVAGKSDIYIGLPGQHSTLMKLGEQRDQTSISVDSVKHNVYGDSHGGPDGPPIEVQMLGQIATVRFMLSKWDHAVRAAMEQHGVFATEGAVADSEVGALLLADRSFRILIKNTRDNTPQGGSFDPFTRNFVCCVVSTPIEVGQGTKHSILTLDVQAHRAPAGHAKVGKLYDRDTTGIPE